MQSIIYLFPHNTLQYNSTKKNKTLNLLKKKVKNIEKTPFYHKDT